VTDLISLIPQHAYLSDSFNKMVATLRPLRQVDPESIFVMHFPSGISSGE
jgi:hypothetical protein